MKTSPFKNEIFHLDGNSQILGSTDKNYEAIPYLATKLFGLPEKCIFTQVATPDDPRGYLDLYGEDPELEYDLGNDSQGFRYHALACYFDHISFSLEDDIECNLIPEGKGIRLQIVDEGAEDSFIEKHIHTRDDLINVITNYLPIAEKEEAEER